MMVFTVGVSRGRDDTRLSEWEEYLVDGEGMVERSIDGHGIWGQERVFGSASASRAIRASEATLLSMQEGLELGTQVE